MLLTCVALPDCAALSLCVQDHPSFIGTYFPNFSSPNSIKQCYEAADGIFFIGKDAITLGHVHACTMSVATPPNTVMGSLVDHQ